MSSAVLFALLFLFGVLALFIGGWLYGRRVKRGADDEAPWALAGARATVQFSPQSVAVLRQLSGEPILLKQTEEGLRVQIENRRMVPSSAFVEQGASGALGEAGVAVTRLYGVRWVVVVSPLATTNSQCSASPEGTTSVRVWWIEARRWRTVLFQFAGR